MSVSMFSSYMNIASEIADDLFMVKDKQKEWKERIIHDWEKTYTMPRKMKKARRKELLLDWSIACYDPFEGWF